ncbi:hypothetical protein N7448_002536 [Penicillium atrosanguineum]|uniref:Acyl-CoA N-acyltransferase n=1 Tax=Penicillium atrosanguineum TaxID=1132637 RepID=UPI00238DD160|nr:Acyl-CoA N-acyltransferase [Penicillium atrosanguineum]KAJ5145144.1 hypothetical protein N7448_002536 [Penicillium atrosanguineum]KAJ5300935.1 Acyl-CoA N-acyltransferase [Penicillium atrosanguineum]
MIEPPRFPLEDHFKWSKSHTLPKDDIKAGCLEGRTLYTYTSAHFRDGKHWWTQVNPDILLDEVKSWIQTKATEVKTGEVVLVYVVGHCTKDDEPKWSDLEHYFRKLGHREIMNYEKRHSLAPTQNTFVQ